MLKAICDRCKKEIYGNTYYTIDINAQDVNKYCDGINAQTFIYNAATAHQNTFKGQRIFCPDCTEAIERVIDEVDND